MAEYDEAPEGNADVALFAKLKGWVVQDRKDLSEWRTEARESIDFVAGYQYTFDEERALLDTGRQPVTFNRVGPIVDVVAGLEINNRQETKFRPRTAGDAKVNDMLTEAARWARDEAQAEDEESDAFRDAVICGIGCVETRLEMDGDESTIAIDRCDPLEMGWDASSTKANLIDRRRAWRIRDVDCDAAKDMFPGLQDAALHAGWAQAAETVDGGEGNKRDYPDKTRDALESGSTGMKRVTLVEIEWCETERRHMLAIAGVDGVADYGDDEIEDAIESAKGKALPFDVASIKRKVWKRAVLGQSSVLEVQTVKGWRWHFITGKRDRRKKSFYGLVRPMRDPAKLANKTFTQVLHILNSNAKGGLLYEADAFANVRDAEKDWTNPQKSVKLNPGGLNKIRERTAPPMPEVLYRLLEFAVRSIPDVTGVNVEIMGIADREQAASLELQRRQSAVTILAPLFDGLRRYRKEQGGTLLECLRMLPPGTLVRVTQDAAPQMGHNGGPQMPQYLPWDPAMFGLDDDTVRFDVIVDQAPSSPNQKEQTWQLVQPFIMPLLERYPALLPEVVKASPLPSAFADRIVELIGEGADPEKQQMQQALQEASGRLQQLETDKSIEAGKVDNDRLKILVDAASKGVMVGADGSIVSTAPIAGDME